jgi:hypothetical protein
VSVIDRSNWDLKRARVGVGRGGAMGGPKTRKRIQLRVYVIVIADTGKLG